MRSEAEEAAAVARPGELRDGAEASDSRRAQILNAALEVIAERGFPDTRIADVATRAEVSPALVVYYFKTKDRLLTEAIRYAEDSWYAEGARRMAEMSSAAKRLEVIVAMTCLDGETRAPEESWSIWLDLWAAAVRHAEVRAVREQFDEHWRETIRSIVREGQANGEFEPVDVDDFAVGFSALLDGLAIQIALEDPDVSPRRAFDLSMRVAAAQLGFSWSMPRARGVRSR
jgi:AcrR family transcriptional regulator